MFLRSSLNHFLLLIKFFLPKLLKLYFLISWEIMISLDNSIIHELYLMLKEKITETASFVSINLIANKFMIDFDFTRASHPKYELLRTLKIMLTCTLLHIIGVSDNANER